MMKIIELFWVVLRFFGWFNNINAIPNGVYCYEPDEDKNKTTPIANGYWIKPCPYYKIISKRYNGCQREGVVTDDPVFADQCKICESSKERISSHNSLTVKTSCK